jgi:hypothetical protein
MTLQLSVNIPKWLVDLHCTFHQTTKKSKAIQTIWVENPKLTASYFKEYLGFYIVAKAGRGRNNTILIHRMGNWICIKSTLNKSTLALANQVPKVTLRIKNIEKEYLNRIGSVMMIKHLDQYMAGEKLFIAKDCNGTEIVYCSDILN